MDHQRAFELALRALNARDRSERELRSFLERRQVEPDLIDDVIRAAAGEGLIDDAGYAQRFTEDRRLLDRWGNERIARDLVRRGIQRELIDEALAGHGAEDEIAVAIELLDRRFPLPFDGDRERDKAWRMLVRRGYEPELAYSAVRRHEQGLADAA
ncbi:MAG: regulatory protein [Thermoleophilaceae bacterium]|jgi:regulatory protein|nr:regulatory protein [Thermoleophilaceae bacterium]